MFDKYFEKREIKDKFLKEHDLPKYSPDTGIRLKWKVSVIQNGPYDPKTGEPLGDFEVIVKQILPSCSDVRRDNRVYIYNIEKKELEVSDSYIWTF